MLLLGTISICSALAFFDFNTALATAFQIVLIFKSILITKSATKSSKEILTCLFISPEPALFLFFGVILTKWLLGRLNTPKSLATKYIYFIAMYSATLFIYNVASEKLILNYIIWLCTFFSGLALFVYGRSIAPMVNIYSLLKFLGFFFILQIVFILFQATQIYIIKPGDWPQGTLADAHKIGLIFLFACTYLILSAVARKNTGQFIALIICVYLLYLTDAKSIILCFILAIPFFVVMLAKLRIKTKTYFILNNPAAILYLLLPIYSLAAYLILQSSSFELYEVYFLDDLLNSKYVFFTRVWIDILNDSPISWLVGTGPGTLGSRASNILSADVLYKETTAFLSSSSEWTRMYMKGLWTEELALLISNYSAVLSYPFSGISSLKAELGFPGLIAYLLFILHISLENLKSTNFKSRDTINSFKISLSLILISYVFMLFFDNYNEQPAVSYILLFLTSIFMENHNSPNHKIGRLHHKIIKGPLSQ